MSVTVSPDLGVSDEALFASTMENEPAPAQVEEAPKAEDPAPASVAPVRDEQGRFAPKAEAQQPAPAAPAEQPSKVDEQGHAIPAWRFNEVNNERKQYLADLERERQERIALQRQFEAMQQQLRQPPPPPPDMYADPEGYQRYNQNLLQQGFADMQRNFSLKIAEVKHGDVYQKAVEFGLAAKARGEFPEAAIAGASDPGEALVSWYKRETVLKETGGDLKSYRDKALEEALKDPAFLARAVEAARASAGNGNGQAKPQTAINLPPSLSRIAPAAPVIDSGPGDMSDSSLFRFATSR